MLKLLFCIENCPAYKFSISISLLSAGGGGGGPSGADFGGFHHFTFRSADDIFK